MKSRRRKTTDAGELMDQWYGGDPEWDRMVAEEEIRARIGQVVYHIRTQANLTQVKLAEMIGTTQPVISRVENGDYQGSALEMLMRVCLATNRRFEVAGPGVPLSGSDDSQCAVVVSPS